MKKIFLAIILLIILGIIVTIVIMIKNKPLDNTPFYIDADRIGNIVVILCDCNTEESITIQEEEINDIITMLNDMQLRKIEKLERTIGCDSVVLHFYSEDNFIIHELKITPKGIDYNDYFYSNDTALPMLEQLYEQFVEYFEN